LGGFEVRASNCGYENMNETRKGDDCGVSIPPEFYSDFEERFRGTCEEIARRQSIYLPILEKAEIFKSNAPILDIGCGRGEWLKLLGQRGYKARGVDLNENFVLECQQKGLEIVSGEAIQYLHNQPPESFSAVTSFHVVEHLPFARLVEFVAEIFRGLRPGGVMILETPNPENITVGACSFYLDPSHLAPIPPALLQFISAQAGFASPCVARVNAETLGVPLAYLPREASYSLQLNAVIHLLNQIFYRSPDYSIIAQKGGGEISITGSAELNHLCERAPMDIMHFRQLEAETKAREAETKAREAEAKTREAETKAREAEAKTREAEAKAQEAGSQLHELLASTSWRFTAPLRSVNRFIKMFFHSL
jgi:SAM-dependent methyltransferase